jgi:Cof subfamily protein (haloacid dehalogenase superfamily)
MKNINKEKIKMIITDLDNTYINKGVMSEYGKSIIKKLIENNYYVVFATGRNKKHANNVLNNDNIYYVVMNGTSIYKGNSSIEKTGHFEKEQMNFLLNCLKPYDACSTFVSDYSTVCCYDLGQYMNTIFIKNELSFGKEGANAVIPTQFVNDVNVIKEDIYKIEVSFYSHENYLKACKVLSNIKEINVYDSDRDYIEINNNNSSKAHGCMSLCEKLNINLDEVIVFGDSKNDLENLKTFPYSVCVSNANEEVKKVCYDTCDTNKNDGVAHYLDSLLF